MIENLHLVVRPGRPRAGDLDRRLARAMETATQMFIERGFVGTTIIDIARDAGVAPATLYQHLGDKEAIFRAIILDPGWGLLLEAPHFHDGDTLVTALHRAGAYVRDVFNHPQAMGLMRLMIAERMRFPTLMASFAQLALARFLQNIEIVFIAAQDANLIPDGNQTRNAQLFFDIIGGNGSIIIETTRASPQVIFEDLDERIQLFVNGRFGSKNTEIRE